MKRNLFALAAIASLALLGGCAVGDGAISTGVLLQVDDIATGAQQTQPAVVEFDGQPALLYATQDNRIVFQRGNERVQLDETARVRGGNRFQLQVHDKQLQALWWSHLEGKSLYFTSSADGGKAFAPVSIVNDTHGVLGPFSLLHGTGGVLGMTYLDEREPPYQAYFNRSSDYGRTWAKPDQRLDFALPDGQKSYVQSPQSVESGTAWVSAWADAVKVGGTNRYRVVSRRSDDAGLNWSPQEIIFSSDKLISSLMVRAQGGQIVIAADESERGIVAFASKDEGRSWRSAGAMAGTEVAPGTDGASSSGIELAVAGEQAHLLWMQDRKGQKTRIMHGTLDLAQAKWLGAAQRLDVKAVENTRSMLPTIMALPGGQVLASWVDYRDIRPNIYLSASFDRGQSWSAPQPLLKRGEVSAGWPKLLPWGKQAAIGYDIYPNEQLLKGKYVLRLLPLAEGAKALPEFVAPATVNDAERKARLEQRVKMVWQNRVDGNYDAAYDVFDFAFKAFSSKKTYLENVGVILYQSFSLMDSAITGNEAEVKMKFKYEIKPTIMPNGKSIKVAPVEVEASNTWVWVKDDWYMVYAPSFGQANLQY